MSDECDLFIRVNGYYKKALVFNKPLTVFTRLIGCLFYLVAKNITFQANSNELEITERLTSN